MSEHTMITEKQSPNPQKVKWRNVAYYDNFDAASNHRDTLVDEHKVKVRRCGVDGIRFVVKVGTTIKVAPVEPPNA